MGVNVVFILERKKKKSANLPQSKDHQHFHAPALPTAIDTAGRFYLRYSWTIKVFCVGDVILFNYKVYITVGNLVCVIVSSLNWLIVFNLCGYHFHLAPPEYHLIGNFGIIFT